MKRVSLALLAVATALITWSCAHQQSIYQNWGKQLAEELPRRNARVEDVSFLLGVGPTRCEQIAPPPPAIGVIFGRKDPLIATVRPNSPAEKAGLRPGDGIKAVNGHPVSNLND